MRRAIPLVLLGMALFASPAAAQFKSQAGVCFAGTGKFELDISFCSLAIQSRRHEGPSVAALYTHRGRARLELGDLGGAVADFDTALEHNPVSALAYNERGRARHRAGDNTRAVADYDAALVLNPRYGAAYRNRGTARIHEGRLRGALADLDAAVDSVNYDPASRILRGIARYLSGDYDAAIPDLSAALIQAYPYPQAVLWIYLAGRRSGRDGKEDLAENAEAMSAGAWPDALIEAFLGERSHQAVLEAAEHPRDDIRRRRLTQAHFYLGELANVNGDTAMAQKHFQAAFALDLFEAIERTAATLSLERLPR